MIDEDYLSVLDPLAPGKVHPLRRPEKEAAPAIVYSILADEPDVTLCGASRLHIFTVRVDCYAATYIEARTLAAQAAAALEPVGPGGTVLKRSTPGPDFEEALFQWTSEFTTPYYCD